MSSQLLDSSAVKKGNSDDCVGGSAVHQKSGVISIDMDLLQGLSFDDKTSVPEHHFDDQEIVEIGDPNNCIPESDEAISKKGILEQPLCSDSSIDINYGSKDLLDVKNVDNFSSNSGGFEDYNSNMNEDRLLVSDHRFGTDQTIFIHPCDRYDKNEGYPADYRIDELKSEYAPNDKNQMLLSLRDEETMKHNEQPFENT
jgi:hypothetical protein